MGGVRVTVHCTRCRTTWVEIAFKPENWEGWRRVCPVEECGQVGLSVLAPPENPTWVPEEDS